LLAGVLQLKGSPLLDLPGLQRVRGVAPQPGLWIAAPKDPDRTAAASVDLEARISFAYGQAEVRAFEPRAWAPSPRERALYERDLEAEKQRFSEVLGKGVRTAKPGEDGDLRVVEEGLFERALALRAKGWRVEIEGRVLRAEGEWKARRALGYRLVRSRGRALLRRASAGSCGPTSSRGSVGCTSCATSASAAASPTTWGSARRCRCWRCSPANTAPAALPRHRACWWRRVIISYYIIAFTQFPDDTKFADIALPSIDIMLTMVPPGLTLCLVAGIQFAQKRLSDSKISALKGRLINASGRMKVVFFDKTGTLTINEVKLDAVHASRISKNDTNCVHVPPEFSYQNANPSDAEAYSNMLLMQNFATNHTLVLSKEGRVLGDPLEEELLNFSHSTFSKASSSGAAGQNKAGVMKNMKIEKGGAQTELEVLDIFGFKPELQRMSVIARNATTGDVYCFVKGAPERIVQLVDQATLPKNINKQITDFAKSGYRVLAFAAKKIQPSANYNRDDTEKGGVFQGLALFKNSLKDATFPTLEKLKKADFYTGMITGDNINTAISVSKTCGLVDTKYEEIAACTFNPNGPERLTFNLVSELGDVSDTPFNIEDRSGSKGEGKRKIVGALDNVNFAKIVAKYGLELNKEIDLAPRPIAEIATYVRVFARMNPEQKALIVKIMKSYYKRLQITVGYCGDGANDCIALKHADIGVSLSKTEASLSAPFVSAIEDISCIEQISIQGKAALTTNYDCFRYFCLYSIIQTIGLLFLFSQQTEYSIAMYLTMDVPIALNLATLIGVLGSKDYLVVKLPKYTLIYLKYVVSMVLNALYTFGFIILALYVVKQDANFMNAPERYDLLLAEALARGEEEPARVPTYEATVISLLAIQGTYHIAMSFNLAGTFKQRFYKNVYFIISFIIYILFILYLLYCPDFNFWRSPRLDPGELQHGLIDERLKMEDDLDLGFYSIASVLTEVVLIWVFTSPPKRTALEQLNEEEAHDALPLQSPETIVVSPEIYRDNETQKLKN
jgi:magnesium-transporting ATPase (P-type)